MSQPFSRAAVRIVLLSLFAFVAGCAAATLKLVSRNGVPLEPFTLASPAEVTITRHDVSLSPLPLHLQEGDEIRTGPATEVLLRFPRAYVLVRPNTHVTVKCIIINGPTESSGPSDEPPDFSGSKTPPREETAGSVVVKARGGFASHATPVNAGVKGTKYTFRVDRSQAAHIKVYEGTVAATSPTGAWGEVLVHEGEAIDVAGTAPPQKRVLSPEENVTLDAAFEAFDRLLDLSGF